jgi:cytochrome c peroxidase
MLGRGAERSWRIALLSCLPFISSVAPGAELRLAVAPEWAGQALAVPSSPRPNAAGQAVSITRLSALLSDFMLRRADGSGLYLPGRYGWIDAAAGRTEVELGEVPDGDYAGLEFTVGLPAAVDRGDASRWPARHPLNPLTNGLYWGWQGGYVFAAIEGDWQSAAGSWRGFSFHLAAGVGAMRAQLAVPFALRGPATLRCAWDLAGLLRPLRFEEDGRTSSTHSRADDPLAAFLAGGVARGIGWRGLQSGAASGPGMNMAGPVASEPMPPREPSAEPWPLRAPLPPPIPLTIPAGFPQPELPMDNPLTLPGVALGRTLFSDPRLSGTGSQSCASCHQAAHAYADPSRLSRGASGAVGSRRSPSLLNLAWQPAFAWDGSKPRIRDQALAAIAGAAEMHGDPAAAAAALARDPRAAGRFQEAFGSLGVTAERIGLALEQYLLTLVSADSRFDRAARGEGSLSPEESRGLQLFLTEYDPAHGRRGADCFHCHGGALFGDFAYRDNGLGGDSADRGRGAVTGRAADDGKFKTPSLRNVALRAPYMHDGSLPDLPAVVAHYAHGVKRTPNLDPNLGKHPDAGMDLSVADQAALVAFLRTLTSTFGAERSE